MSADLLAKPGIRRLIQATAKVYEQALDSPSISYEIPSEMRQKLEEDIFVFSGFKTYHQLKEASLLLRDDAGHIKPFSKFYQDVSQIKEKYNRNWLRAEYNFATASAEMASHWAEYATHKEYTNLQYHTALDDKVRESHAALEGITLPYEDSFWNTAFPPNGWNCRCHVVPVLKEDYPVSDSQTAQQSFEMLTEGSEIFRFNPGKQSAIFPPHHPYYGKQGYRHCKNPHLAHSLDSDPSDPCGVYRKLLDILDALVEYQRCFTEVETTRGKVRIHKGVRKNEREANKRIAVYKAEKYGEEIDLVPAIGTKKSADAYNRTLGHKEEYKSPDVNTYNSFDQALKVGHKQADYIVIYIQGDYKRGDLENALKGRFKRHSNLKGVQIIHDGDDVTYSREDIEKL